MNRIPEEKYVGLAATVVFHAIVLLLLWLLAMTIPPQLPEEGVSVVLGNVEEASGDEMLMTEVEVVAPQPMAVEPQPALSEPVDDEPLISSTDESIPVDTLLAQDMGEAKSAEQLEEERRLAEAAERKRLEDEAKAKANSLMAGAFGKGSVMLGKGDDVESGNDGVKGSVDGNTDEGKTEGAGGMGTYDLAGRSLGPAGLPKPVYDVQESGRVVVTIIVNPQGNVVSASINSRTNTTSQALRDAAIAAAKKATFNVVSGVDNQEGTIIYYFKLK